MDTNVWKLITILKMYHLWAYIENWWLKNAELKTVTEGLIIKAEDQSLPTKNYQVSIKNASNPICKLCEQKIESVDNIVSSCTIKTLIEYKERHDKIGRYIHWKICKYNGTLDCKK